MLSAAVREKTAPDLVGSVGLIYDASFEIVDMNIVHTNGHLLALIVT